MIALPRIGGVHEVPTGSELVSCDHCHADLWLRPPTAELLRSKPKAVCVPVLCKDCASKIRPDIAEMNKARQAALVASGLICEDCLRQAEAQDWLILNDVED
jgi:hypothetical protein